MSSTYIKEYKLAFLHNSLAEYRIAFWNDLNKYCDVTIFLTTEGLEDKIYGLTKGKLLTDVKKIKFKNIKNLESCDKIILPPIDSVRNFFYTYIISRRFKYNTILWTEKWDAPNDKQPLAKKIKNKIQYMMFRTVCKKVSCCIAAGTKSQEYLLKLKIHNLKIKKVIDSSTSYDDGNQIDFMDKYGILHTERVILYLGRIIKRKGLRELIMAFKRADLLNAKLLICGEGEYEDECRKLAEGYNNIVFAGKIQPNERLQYYNRADVFVLPSVIIGGVIEAWGLTVNEALACGTPVIASTAVGATYDLIDENNGMVYDENDVNELTKCLKSALDSKIWDKEKIRNDYRIYNVENMAKNFYLAVFGD